MAEQRKPFLRTRDWAEKSARNNAEMIELSTGYKASEEEIKVLVLYYMDEISEEECRNKLNTLRKGE